MGYIRFSSLSQDFHDVRIIIIDDILAPPSSADTIARASSPGLRASATFARPASRPRGWFVVRFAAYVRLVPGGHRRGAVTLNPISTVRNASWLGDPTASERIVETLESGSVVYIPDLGFPITDDERAFFGTDALNLSSKNVSYDPSTRAVRGLKSSHSATDTGKAVLGEMMARYLRFGEELFAVLLGEYAQRLTTARTSFRPVEIEGRNSRTVGSNDTLLHVDSFSSRPLAGQRILRMFTNVNPDGQARTWKVGEPFEDVAKRFVPKVKNPWLGERAALQLFRLTKSYRTLYDHYMLRVQMTMKADAAYQRSVPQTRVDFPPGSTWICFTDQVSHAALSGRHVLEQTFYLPVERMERAARSPLRVLESMLDRRLA